MVQAGVVMTCDINEGLLLSRLDRAFVRQTIVEQVARLKSYFRRLQLRNHLGRVPVGPDILALAVRVYFEDVDAFKLHFLAAAAGSLPRPFHRRAVAGDEN